MKRNFSTFKLFNLSTAVVAAAMAAAINAPAVTIELLKDGEGSNISDNWTNTGGFGVQRNNETGISWFRASYNVGRLSQDVTLADYGISAEDIQSGIALTASVTAFATERVDNNEGSATCRVVVYEYGANDELLAANVVLDKAGTYFDETAFTTNFTLNSGTRTVKYEVVGQSIRYWSGLYGPGFRNCSLTFNKPLTVSFVSSGTTLDAISDDAPPIAPRHGDDLFLGYFTAEGDQVYDENYEFVMDASSVVKLPENVTLYAQWQPVARTPEGGITRLVYRGVLKNFGTWESGLAKNMSVKVYDSASATTPLWSGDVADVPINPDGSFEAVFGNDELALAFASNDVTHVELTVGDALSPLAPRRAFASVANVNRALVAEGAASDIKVGTLGANALIAEKITAGSLEATGTVRVEGSVSVEVKPFDIERGQETTIWRGAGVSAWGESKRVATANGVVAGQKLWTADREGVAVIHATGSSRSTLRIPATIQFVRPGDEVRAPTWDGGEVTVTVWGYKK
ncbi:MAG: hypothetical protein IJ783_09240 [Kiritimatiellae bacterium]|nr:hypothetical protein [Kiritimatiellia bacterium]